jgi:hypothetical protein
MRVLGIIASVFCLIVGGVMVALALGLRGSSGGSSYIGFVLLCLGVALLLWFVALHIAELFVARIIWNDQEIRSEAPWRGSRSIRWEDLQRVSYRDMVALDAGVDNLLLRSTGGDKLVITVGRIGFADFARDVLRLAPPEAVAPFRQSLTRKPWIASQILG